MTESSQLITTTREFFQLYAAKWEDILVTLFDDVVLSRSEPPGSIRSLVVILLYKREAAANPANYILVALLNTIVKILTKDNILRLKKGALKLVPDVETGFLPRYSVNENLILLHDALI